MTAWTMVEPYKNVAQRMPISKEPSVAFRLGSELVAIAGHKKQQKERSRGFGLNVKPLKG